MAATPTQERSTPETPATIYWQFTDDGGVEPNLTIHPDEHRETIFEAHDVTGLEELGEKVSGGPHAHDPVRLGVLAGKGDDATYHTDVELLASVDGVTADLAEGLIDWWDDIPTLCEEYRRQGPVLLGDLLNDARVSDKDWVPALEALIEDLDRDGAFEQRLKDAGVWVEPDNAVAEH